MNQLLTTLGMTSFTAFRADLTGISLNHLVHILQIRKIVVIFTALLF